MFNMEEFLPTRNKPDTTRHEHHADWNNKGKRKVQRPENN